ncbi:uncharacterized protein LOC131235300 [Magnolia sinica]|uniref:uncharacterized protein LOC131235300 n=1 Tax=Magnolia sinica TaxID=86752 RepID=UPI0026583081|nr:uncharacterized protein LOC131235300 [Magnolia sinica]
MAQITWSALAIACAAMIASISAEKPTCRSYCGNLTVDYPFGIRSGCGHSGFRDLLFCVNDVLMFHIRSGSYRVLDIDYGYRALTLHDRGMSTCDSLERGKGNGFVLEPWRAPYLEPAPDNVFMLIGCRGESPLFQGFPGKHLPCRNVSGMGCDEYYGCTAWDTWPKRDAVYGTGPPECCSVPFGAIRAINLTRLECEGYSSAYSLAPLQVVGPSEWMYGIRVNYNVPGDYTFCRACEATGGTCGFDGVAFGDLCLCGGWNSTSNCDSDRSLASRPTSSVVETLPGLFLACIVAWMTMR